MELWSEHKEMAGKAAKIVCKVEANLTGAMARCASNVAEMRGRMLFWPSVALDLASVSYHLGLLFGFKMINRKLLKMCYLPRIFVASTSRVILTIAVVLGFNGCAGVATVEIDLVPSDDQQVCLQVPNSNSMEVKVENTGQHSAAEAEVLVTGVLGDFTYTRFGTTSSIPAGQSQTISFPDTNTRPPTEGSMDITITVDPANKVMEGQENNNVLHLSCPIIN